MATLQLTLEQVNFEAEELISTPYEFEDPIFKVVDPNIDFSTSSSSTSSTSIESSTSLDKNHEYHQVISSTDVIPQSPIVVYDDIYPDPTSPKCNPSLPEVHGTKTFPSSKHSKQSSSSSESTSYPCISSEVAQYLCRVNPHLLQNMELTLSNLETSKIADMSAVARNNNSSLMHLSNTSDALSLQETVIGLWRRLISWKELINLNYIVICFQSHFFPKFMKVLREWLNLKLEFEEIMTWNLKWKKIFTGQLLKHPAIKNYFNQAANLIEKECSNLSPGI